MNTLSAAGNPHLGPASAVEKNVGRLEVAVDGLLAVKEMHARTDVSDDAPRLLFRKRLLGVVEQAAEVPAGEQLHHENQTVRPQRDGPVHTNRVGAAEASHGLKLAQESLALAFFALWVGLTASPSL